MLFVLFFNIIYGIIDINDIRHLKGKGKPLTNYIMKERKRALMLKIKQLDSNSKIPTKNHIAAAYDLYASRDCLISPNSTEKVHTDIAIELPEGYFAQIVPRSGITLKTDLLVQLGTIDNDYRGELGIIVYNKYQNPHHYQAKSLKLINNETEKLKDVLEVDKGTYLIKKGDKIAQLVIHKENHFDIEVVDILTDTTRDTKGFGSSGTK